MTYNMELMNVLKNVNKKCQTKMQLQLKESFLLEFIQKMFLDLLSIRKMVHMVKDIN